MNNLNKHPANCYTSMKLLGDYWTLRIIDTLESGVVRFCELQRNLDDLNPVTLTDRLKKLESAGLIERNEDIQGKLSVCYSLTPLGSEVLPVIHALDRFSLKATELAKPV